MAAPTGPMVIRFFEVDDGKDHTYGIALCDPAGQPILHYQHPEITGRDWRIVHDQALTLALAANALLVLPDGQRLQYQRPQGQRPPIVYAVMAHDGLYVYVEPSQETKRHTLRAFIYDLDEAKAVREQLALLQQLMRYQYHE